MVKVQKLFDKNGNLKVRFAVDAKQEIKDWLSKNNTTEEEGIKHSAEVDCPVFGKALEFPCTVHYN